MKKENADKWIEALLSGKFKQGKGRLVKSDEYNSKVHCCLGVLAEINGCKVELYTSALDSEMQEKCDIGTKYGTYNSNQDQNLADLNDNGATFEEIAEVIKKHYKDL